MANSNVHEKLDFGLRDALRAWQEVGEPAAAAISVELRYEGDLAPIEALGFEKRTVATDSALGIVYFKDIPALVAHPGVIWISAGRRRRKDLNIATRDIRARATAPVSGAPVDGVWHADTTVSGGPVSSVPNATGEDVIVAIIDTGIDYKHPMFLSQLSPKVTRILKIWDQGLTPNNIGECPAAALIGSGNRYGVEYDKNEIEADLNGGTAIRHRDCDGHGTHVAGIAAGGNVFPTGGDATKVGVAPKASIIVVKYLDTPDDVFARTPANAPGAVISWTDRFRDAILYCLRNARDEFGNKPVVINLSLGASSSPGDGLDDDARWLDERLDPTQAASAPTDFYPQGAIVVSSAGNDGDVANDRLTAIITIPAAGSVQVPLQLTDHRGGFRRQWRRCSMRSHKPSIGVHFWYQAPSPLSAVTFAMQVPHGTMTTPPHVAGNPDLELGYRFRVTPPTVTVLPASSSVHQAVLANENNPAVPHPAGGTVHRHHVEFFVSPKETGGDVFYNPGMYTVEIHGPVGHVFYVMCEEEFWDPSGFVGFAIGDGVAPLPFGINLTNESSATDTLGRNVITVASFDDKNSLTVVAGKGFIAPSSSRGPLRNFGSPHGVIAAKPDIAAPGVDIMSAQGIDVRPGLRVTTPGRGRGLRFQELSGTSMAAPMVSGVVALMLDKTGTLNVTQVRTALFSAPDPAVNPSTVPAATNAYGRGRVNVMTTHIATP